MREKLAAFMGHSEITLVLFSIFFSAATESGDKSKIFENLWHPSEFCARNQVKGRLNPPFSKVSRNIYQKLGFCCDLTSFFDQPRLLQNKEVIHTNRGHCCWWTRSTVQDAIFEAFGHTYLVCKIWKIPN